MISTALVWLTAVANAAIPVNVNCNADLLCVDVYKEEQVRLVLRNFTKKPLSFRLFLSGNVPVERSPTMPLDGPAELELVSFPNSGMPWSFEYRIHYGHERFTHDDGYVYTLPYAPGSGYLVTQSHTNLTTHHSANRYAIDFAMPVGEAVHAARGGLVVSAYAESATHSTSGDASANHLWIQHSDGTIGKYLHLDHEGILVREGDWVQAGDLVGVSGNTGFSLGAHLHFSVSTSDEEDVYKTFDIQFETHSGAAMLISGERYWRPRSACGQTTSEKSAEPNC